jgi:hypothetical protein
MPKADTRDARLQQALHQLQRSRLQLLVAVHQTDDTGVHAEPSTDGWSLLQPWIAGGLGALPWVSSLVSKLFAHGGQVSADTAPADATSQPASLDRLADAVRRHPVLSVGLALALGGLLWRQRQGLRHFIAANVLPEVMSTLSVQAAPHLSAWLQQLLAPQEPPTHPPHGPADTSAPPEAAQEATRTTQAG